MFNSIFNQPLQRAQCAHTHQATTGTPSSAPAVATSPFLPQTILSQFVGFLRQQQLKHKTIKSYLASIRFFHIINNRGDPFIQDMPWLQYVIRGIKSEEARKDKQSRPRLPITPAILSEILQILLKDPYSFDNIMLWAASLLCFFGFLRSGEITIPTLNSYDPSTHLGYSNISVDNPANPTIIKAGLSAQKPTLSVREWTST